MPPRPPGGGVWQATASQPSLTVPLSWVPVAGAGVGGFCGLEGRSPCSSGLLREAPRGWRAGQMCGPRPVLAPLCPQRLCVGLFKFVKIFTQVILT